MELGSSRGGDCWVSSPAGCVLPQAPTEILTVLGVRWQLGSPSWGEAGVQRGLDVGGGGKEAPGRRLTLLRRPPPQPLWRGGGGIPRGGSHSPCSDQTPAEGVMQTGVAGGSRPSYLTLSVVFCFFPVSSKRFSAKVSH